MRISDWSSDVCSSDLLYLYGNNIGCKGAEYIAKLIKFNKFLVTLDLCYNNIGDKGVEYIAKSLKTNKSLTTLNLCSNNINEKGAEYIIDALKFSSSRLINLYLYKNNINDRKIKNINQLLKSNKINREKIKNERVEEKIYFVAITHGLHWQFQFLEVFDEFIY